MGARAPTHVLAAKKDYREDLWVRQDFLESHSGRVFCMSCPVSDFDLELVTHAAGSTGM